MGIVYLIQPEEYIGTDIYKIGMSTKKTLERPYKGYGSNHEIKIVKSVFNASFIEKELIKIFNDKFDLEKGREYFKGELNQMEKIFIDTILSKNKDNEDEDDEFEYDEKIYLKDLFLCLNTFKDPDGCEIQYKPKYFWDFDNDNPSLEIKIKINPLFPKDGYFIEVKNGYKYFIYDRYTTFVFNDLIKKKILKLNKKYDIFDQDFLKMLDIYKKNIDDEILDICYITLFEMHEYNSLFDKSNDFLFILHTENMKSENDEFNEKISKLKENYEKIKQLEHIFEVNWVGPKYNSHEIHRFNFIRKIIKKVKESIESTENKIKIIKETKIEYKNQYLQIARKNCLYDKVNKKIYDIINIIHDTFTFIKVNKKYSIITLTNYNEKEFIDEEIRYYIPYIHQEKKIMENIFDFDIDYKLK